jgi:hypothetical protein
MTLKEAFEIVLSLANDNVLDDSIVANDEDLKEEQEHQNEAVELVQQYFETHIE